MYVCIATIYIAAYATSRFEAALQSEIQCYSFHLKLGVTKIPSNILFAA